MVLPVNMPEERNTSGIKSTIIFSGMPVAMLDTAKVVRPEMVNVLESYDEVMNLIDAA
jgi:hypothetical protein